MFAAREVGESKGLGSYSFKYKPKGPYSFSFTTIDQLWTVGTPNTHSSSIRIAENYHALAERGLTSDAVLML